MPNSCRSFAGLLFPRAIPYLFTFFITTALLVFPQNTSADNDSREYILKAGFIYNFTKFIQWPDEINKSIQDDGVSLCVIGEDPFGEILDQLSNNLKSKGKILSIRRPTKIDALQSCHIVFISQSNKSRLSQIIKTLHEAPVLLIGDTPQFSQMGVGINFFIEGNRIRFEINKNSLELRGFQISSELLDLARIIEGTD